MNERALKFTPLPRMADCITETTGDLFELPGVKCIAHCISADCEMGAGFAKRVAARYGGASFRQRAAARSPRIGEAVPVLAEGGVLVYNLVTKARYFEKPTLHALGEALVSMREYARTAGIRRITMPRIGCGLDRLEWSDVRALLDKTYRGSGIEIVVVELVAKSARATTIDVLDDDDGADGGACVREAQAQRAARGGRDAQACPQRAERAARGDGDAASGAWRVDALDDRSRAG